MWTLFWDMHSGGGCKEEPYEKIYIEADEEDAKIIFYNRFGHNPERVSCTCCGQDYSISSEDTLEQVSGYHRGCRYDDTIKGYVDEPDGRVSWNKYKDIGEYKKDKNVLIISKEEILDEERVGEIPEQEYVWLD